MRTRRWLLLPATLLLPFALHATAAPARRGGKYVDVWGARPAAVERISRHAEDAAERFVAIYGSFPGKRVAILLYRSVEDMPSVPWKRTAGWSMPFPDVPEADPPAGEEDDGSAFRDLFADFAFREHVNGRAHASLRRSHNEVGSYLADWLDLAVKTLLQTKATRKRDATRLAGMLAENHIPLEEMFVLRLDEVLGIDRARQPRPGIVEIEPDLRQTLFHEQPGSVAEYLLETYGPEFWRHAVATFAAARPMKRALPWLKNHRTRLASPDAPIPESVAELEKAWLAWARKR